MLPLLFLLLATISAAQDGPRPNLPWADGAQFVFQEQLSDEFRGRSLNKTKWDDHASRNPDTGCPRWNGPSHEDQTLSTYFPGSTNPVTGKTSVRQYALRGGRLWLKMSPKPLSYFKKREYYCDLKTFTCNHDPSISCYKTNFLDEPVYIDEEKTMYAAVVHDKCKKEPFCIPHYQFVSGQANRTYGRLAAAHIASKSLFKYGYVETKVRLNQSPTILAIWMNNDDLVDGFCRYRKSEGPFQPRLECPSLIRSRRWQEIDMLEGMNSELFKTKYMPNIHAFTMYKGEYTSKNDGNIANGAMGGGPIMTRNIFKQKNPSFEDVPEDQRLDNDFHMNPGVVHELDAPWANKLRTIGMYWSPNEIRYYVDGKAVARFKNTIIHQPMNLRISHALNVKWSKQEPTLDELKRSHQVHYLRTWKVFTEEGVEPPSELDLDVSMEEKFVPRFGNEMFGIFDRFPSNDRLSMLPTIPNPNDTIIPEPELPEASRVFDGAPPDLDLGGGNVDFISTELADMTRKLRRKQRFRNYSQAGGPGNQLSSLPRDEMTPLQKRVSLLRPDRAATIIRKNGKAVSTVILEDAERTLFESINPNKIAAGWASTDGLGMDADMA